MINEDHNKCYLVKLNYPIQIGYLFVTTFISQVIKCIKHIKKVQRTETVASQHLRIIYDTAGAPNLTSYCFPV